MWSKGECKHFKLMSCSEHCGDLQIGFAVTKKDAGSDWQASLRAVWVYLLYYLLIFSGVMVNVWRYFTGNLTTTLLMAQVRTYFGRISS